MRKKNEKRNKTEKMISVRSQMTNILIVTVILAATLIFLFNNIYDPENPITASNWRDLNWVWLIPAVLCLVFSVSFEAFNLWILCRKIGYARPFRQSVVYASSDIYFSAITPSATGGQPAAAYYMTKSGMPLSLSSAILILNVTLYTIGLLVIGLLAFVMRPDFFIGFSGIEKMCVLLGIGLHAFLIIVCLICMFSKRVVFFIGDLLYTLLAKLHLVKDKETKIASFHASVSTYRAALGIVRQHRWLLPVLFCNALLQRLILVPITYFVFRAIGVSAASFNEIFSMQLYCTVGASAMPLPGGAGIAETLYVSVFDKLMPGNDSLCMFSMLLSRGISSYLAIIVCGIITMTHHMRMKNAEYHRRRMAPPFDQLTGADDDADETVVAVSVAADPSPDNALPPEASPPTAEPAPDILHPGMPS